MHAIICALIALTATPAVGPRVAVGIMIVESNSLYPRTLKMTGSGRCWANCRWI